MKHIEISSTTFFGVHIKGAARKSHITFARKLRHSQFTDLIVYMKHNGKEMWFECEQLFLSGKRCVTSRKTAAKETSNQLELKKYAVYDYMQLRRIAVTFLNIRLMYK